MEEVTIFFVAEAGEYLEQGNAQAALSLCRKGIESYPDYPLAYVIMAKAYKVLGESKNYNSILDMALSKFPGNKIVRSLVEESETMPVELERESGNMTYNKEIRLSDSDLKEVADNGRKAFLTSFGSFHSSVRSKTGIKSSDIRIIPGLNSMLLNKKSLIKKYSAGKLSVPPRLNVFDKGNIPDDFSTYTNCFIEMDFAEIPEEDYFLSKARQIAGSAPKRPVGGEPAGESGMIDETSDDTAIFTDTIASIYEMQGAYGQAVKVYENLMASKPGRKQYYEQKISELKDKM